MNIRLATCLACAGVIFGASSVPGDQLPSISVDDHLIHFLEYMCFGALLAWWRAHIPSISAGKALLQATFLGSLYGITDELHQYFIPGRFPDPSDWVADTLGTVAGALIIFSLLLIRAWRSDSANAR
jgi:VanZ family protein